MELEKIMKYKPRFLLKMVISVLSFLLLVYIAFFKKDAMWLETLKVGGPDNMKLVTQLYTSEGYQQQQAVTIQQILASMQAAEPQAEQNVQVAPVQSNTIDAKTLANIKKDRYIEGKENARITIFEYSEVLCPYCKIQKENKVLEDLVDEYKGQVNVIFKHYIVHPQAKTFAEAAECVGAERGTEAFYKFIIQGFALADTSTESLLSLAVKLGTKEKTFTACLNNGTYSDAIDATALEGRTLFGVNGTPGNVVVDNEKGTFMLIAGAYPKEEFIKVIDAMLK